MVRLRFNLGRGDNFRKWQLKIYDGRKVLSKLHYDPSEIRIVIKGATLKNRRSVAEGIFSGKNKTVCAWIDGDQAFVTPNLPKGEVVILREKDKIAYNPRKAPHWTNILGQDIDNKELAYVVTDGIDLYDISEQILTEL